jgi:hypothetical protein
MLDADQTLRLAVAIAAIGAAGATWLACRAVRWLLWRSVRGHVRREIDAALRHAVVVKRGAKGRFAR